jgi:hypothetical protein
MLTDQFMSFNAIFQRRHSSRMSYPNRTHAIRAGDHTRRHLYKTLARYLSENRPTVP